MRVDGTDGDLTDNDNVINAEMAMEAKCAAGQCKSIPDKNLMKIKVIFNNIPLFRNKMFMLDEMFQRNDSKFAIFLE